MFAFDMTGLEPIIFGKIVSPFVRQVEEGLVGGMQESIENKGFQLGQGLAIWLRRKFGKGSHRVGDVVQLADQLDNYVERNPASTPALTEAIMDTRPGDRLSILRGLLTAVFTAADELKEPVVLPGFVTGVDHLAIVDVRTQVFDQRYEEPLLVPTGKARIPTLHLSRKGVEPYNEDPPRPRLWVITNAGPDDLARLTDAAKGVQPVLSRGDEFTQLMADRMLVADITAREVGFAKSTIVAKIWSVGPAALDTLPWTDSTAWVAPMFETLNQLVENRHQFRRNFEAAADECE
jgi:hypothetical protein